MQCPSRAQVTHDIDVSHCKKQGVVHRPEDCWTKHPEKASLHIRQKINEALKNTPTTKGMGGSKTGKYPPCPKCGKTTHELKDCWEAHLELRPAGYKSLGDKSG